MTSISNSHGIMFGFSSKYCSISVSFNPSSILIDYAYKGTNSFLVNTFSWVETLTFDFPLSSEMNHIFYQFCLILAIEAMVGQVAMGLHQVRLTSTLLPGSGTSVHQFIDLIVELAPMVVLNLYHQFSPKMGTLPIS